MNNKTGFNRLGLHPSHRLSLKRNMVLSLFKYERIRTLKSRAREVCRFAEKLITKAKKDTVASRRLVARHVHDKKILVKLFSDLGECYRARNGGYTRIVKVGFRKGDSANLVILELVDRNHQDGSELKMDSKFCDKVKMESENLLSETSLKSSNSRNSGKGVVKKKLEKSSSKVGSSSKSSDGSVSSVKKPQRGGGLRGK